MFIFCFQQDESRQIDKIIIYICYDIFLRTNKKIKVFNFRYSETLNNEYIERIHQMSYSSLSDNGMLQIFRFLIK